MTMKVECPACSQHLEADEGYHGREVSCPSCQAKFAFPAAPGKTVASKCPVCGNELGDGAVLCVGCGYHVQTGQRVGTTIERQPDIYVDHGWTYPARAALMVIFACLFPLSFFRYGNFKIPPLLAFAFLALIFMIVGNFWRIVISHDEQGNIIIKKIRYIFLVPLVGKGYNPADFDVMLTSYVSGTSILRGLLSQLISIIPADKDLFILHLAKLDANRRHPEKRILVYKGESNQQLRDIANMITEATGLRCERGHDDTFWRIGL